MSLSVLQDLDDTQKVLDAWYEQSRQQLLHNQAGTLRQLRNLADRLAGDSGSVNATPKHYARADSNSPMMASPPVGLPGGRAEPDARARTLEPDGGANADAEGVLRRRPDPETAAARAKAAGARVDKGVPCQVLVEFKRKRILQYESPTYVAPGEYVVVGGDRGEDIGLVTHSWVEGGEHPAGESWAEGVGRVLRVASVLEVTQLQGVQTELESRAVEVAQEKVQEHGLPMRIVDAEYQFDRRKLTFYYQSQSRLDFRDLVRDLYKTFRARIWMEADLSSPNQASGN